MNIWILKLKYLHTDRCLDSQKISLDQSPEDIQSDIDCYAGGDEFEVIQADPMPQGIRELISNYPTAKSLSEYASYRKEFGDKWDAFIAFQDSFEECTVELFNKLYKGAHETMEDYARQSILDGYLSDKVSDPEYMLNYIKLDMIVLELQANTGARFIDGHVFAWR